MVIKIEGGAGFCDTMGEARLPDMWHFGRGALGSINAEEDGLSLLGRRR